MTDTLLHARTAAIIETLQRTEWQAATLEDRIMAATVRGDLAEVIRLRTIADAIRESAGQYRTELNTLDAQQRLNLGG